MVTTFPTSERALATSVQHFEAIYAEARGDRARIPWADERAHPALVTWLNAVAPSLVRCGARAIVVGCGLGHDARELMQRGYDVTAFDCSRSAIEWAKRLDPSNARCYVEADLFNAPSRWRHRFDLVIEVNTLQSLTPDLHEPALASIASLLSPHGHMLVICRAADDAIEFDDGPPWALTEEDLLNAASLAGLRPVQPVSIFTDDEDPPVQRMRALLRRT